MKIPVKSPVKDRLGVVLLVLLFASGWIPSAAALQESPGSALPAVDEGLPLAQLPAGRQAAATLLRRPASRDFVVREVGDIQIMASDVFSMLDLAAPDLSGEVLANMVLTTVTELEAVREGIDVPEQELTDRVEQALAQQAASFALEGNSSMPLEEYLAQVHGMTGPDYREHVRRGVLSEMLLARVSRLQQLRETRDQLQILLVDDETLALEIEELLNEGASFSVLAKQHSVHGSSAQGGLMPPISLEVTAPMLDGREGLEVGGILGPAPITLGDQDFYRFLRLVERRAPVEGTWTELRGLVEGDLEQNPMNPDEVAIFEARMLARYRVVRPPKTP